MFSVSVRKYGSPSINTGLRQKIRVSVKKYGSPSFSKFSYRLFFLKKVAHLLTTFKGDDLDVKIRKGEKEIRALENTLRLMNSRNDKLKTTLLRPEGATSDLEEKDALNAQVSLLSSLSCVF